MEQHKDVASGNTNDNDETYHRYCRVYTPPTKWAGRVIGTLAIRSIVGNVEKTSIWLAKGLC